MTLPASAQNQLRQFVEQIERLEEEKKGLAEDIRDKMLEVRACGFDVKIVKQVIKLRKSSKTEREEAESVLATYMHALGMLDGTPMGDWYEQQIERDKLRQSAKALDEVAGTNIVSTLEWGDRVEAKLNAARRDRNRAEDDSAKAG